MALRAGRGARGRALRRDDRAVARIGLAPSPCAARRVVLVGAVDDIVSDRCGLRTVEHRPKRGHAAFLESTIEHNAVPSVHGDEGGAAQIRNHAAGYRSFAMANAAEAIEQRLS